MIIGVCGKIASGKSEVMKFLGGNGFYCIDADKITHDLYVKGGEGVRRISAVFGGAFLNINGSVNREKLRNEVFCDENKLKLLNNIIHPVVYEGVVELIGKSRERNIAIEAVYFDGNFLADLVDKIVWIDRPKKQIMNVLLHERMLNSGVAENAYLAVDLPSRVDFSIKNNGSLKDLSQKIEKILDTW